MLLCFLLAATFWVLKALNKTYENVRVSYPVTFIYNPKTQIPVTEPPKEIVINVDAKGWKLLRKALNLRIIPARIDIRDRGFAKYLTARQLRPYINAAISGLDLNYVVTDTIYFNFEKLERRNLELSLQLSDSSLAKGRFVNSAIQISPKIVTVSGPASLVKSLPSPYFIHLPDSGISESYKKRIPLGFVPENLLKPNVKDVEVAFSVVTLKEKDVQTGIKALNHDTLTGPLTFVPKLVKITYTTMTPDSTLPAGAFEVVADLAEMNPQDSTVLLKLAQKPAKAKTVSISPKKVKVIY